MFISNYLTHLAAEATRLEWALNPFESDDLNDSDGLSLETVNADENSIDGIRPKLVEKAGIPQPSMATEAAEATRVPKKKQPVKQKSATSKTAQGMYPMLSNFFRLC